MIIVRRMVANQRPEVFRMTHLCDMAQFMDHTILDKLRLQEKEVIQYYARRWKIEQMIKDLKQRLGLGDYQVRNLRAIQRHVAVVLLSYFALMFLKVLQWLRTKIRSQIYQSVD